MNAFRAHRRAIGWIAAALLIAATWLIAAVSAEEPTTNPDIPNIVMLDQLSKSEGLYDPVPFDHKAHSQMASMKNGCTTCHHRQPDKSTQPAETFQQGGATKTRSQADASKHPACRTCHEPHRVDLRQPGLKGAYHRQCLNCHREWAHANNCVVCHKPKAGRTGQFDEPSRDDVMGRMHPPSPEPETRIFKTNFAPADGANVMFRHKEHTKQFAVACVTCHQHEESCATCHAPNAQAKLEEERKRPPIDKTWDQTHQKCATCHRRDETRCATCHYKDEQAPPPAFEHAITGQELDRDHIMLKCSACHSTWTAKAAPTCGNADCHKKSVAAVTFPAQRPGAYTPVKAPEAPKMKPIPVPLKGPSQQASATMQENQDVAQR